LFAPIRIFCLTFGVNFPLFFATRTSFRRARPLSRLAIRLAIISIILGVAILEISVSIIYGFEREIQHKIISFVGDIQISAYYSEAEDSVASIPAKDFTGGKLARRFPELMSVEPFIKREGVLKSATTLEGVQMVGVGQPWNESFFKSCLKSGKLPQFPAEGYGKEILISQKTADLLEVGAGDKVKIYFLQEGRVRMRPLSISGIYVTGLAEYDAVTVFCDIRLLQRILNWDSDQVQGFTLRVKDRSKEKVFLLNEKIDKGIAYNLSAETAEERCLEWFQWLELQHQHLDFILIALTIVAVINMSTTVIIIITERTGTIGLLKTLGATNLKIRNIFLWNAFYIITIGVVAGNLLGLGLLYLQDETQFFKMDADNYFVETVPVAWEWTSFLQVNLLFGGICVACMTLPTLLVLRIRPAQAVKM